MIVDFDHVDMLFLLVIENVGWTMGRNVIIKFDKPLTTTIERPRELDEAALFREPIPSLPPGKKLGVPFDTLPARMENGLPLAYEVTMRYEGPNGRKYGEGEGIDWTWASTTLSTRVPRGCPNSLPRSRRSVRSWRSGRGVSAACWCRPSTSAGNTASRRAAAMCSFCVARVQGRLLGRYGTERSGAPGSARSLTWQPSGEPSSYRTIRMNLPWGHICKTAEPCTSVI